MKIITKDEFLKLYSEYYGVKTSNLKQIATHTFTGEELFEFVKYTIHNTPKK